MPKDLPPAILVVGPTASGKSSLAMRIAAEWPVELISVDSAQVYREMQIGTAKPSLTEQALVPHHLIDIRDPTEAYSAAQFRQDALTCMKEVHQRGRIPLLVGGTMLYLNALLGGISALPPADQNIRKTLDIRAAEEGWATLHAELLQVDPLTATRLNPNDSQRIQRALEVYQLTGKPLSTWQGQREKLTQYRWLAIALLPSDRHQLHQQIAERFKTMLQTGLVAELEGLRQRWPLSADLPAMRCVGYRQVWDYLEGVIKASELEEQGIFATRQLAKRQITWLRKLIPEYGWRVQDSLVLDVWERTFRYLAKELGNVSS